MARRLGRCEPLISEEACQGGGVDGGGEYWYFGPLVYCTVAVVCCSVLQLVLQRTGHARANSVKLTGEAVEWLCSWYRKR